MSASVADTQARPQLVAQLVNYGSNPAGVLNVVYVAHDTTTNKIHLQLMLTSGESTLVAGDVVAPHPPPTGAQTLMYLDLGDLGLTSAAWKLLKPHAEGWNCAVFEGDHVIGMAPSASGTVLAYGSPIAIHLDGLQLDAPPTSQNPQLAVNFYNVPGVTTGHVRREVSFPVTALNPPSGQKDLTKFLAVGLESNVVINSVGQETLLENTLTLEFSRTSENVAVPAGPGTLFTVRFVYGTEKDEYGYGALTDTKKAAAVKVVAGDNVAQWKAPPVLDAQSPYWTLQPPADHHIAGTGFEAVSSWNFTEIATSYQPGPTIMIVEYAEVPGYEDGAYSLVLNKVGHAHIRSFFVAPNPTYLPTPTYLQDGKAKVTVSWRVEYAKKLVLSQNGTPTDVTSKGAVASFDAVLEAESTIFALTADGPSAGLDNTDIAHRQAVALPVISSFAGAPLEIYAGSSSHEVELQWDVATTGKVQLTSSSGQVFGRDFDAKGHTTVTVTEPQAITIAPVTGPGVTHPGRNLVLDAVRPVAARIPFAAGLDPLGAAASPSAPFIAVAVGEEVIAFDTVRFWTITTIDVTATHIAFSPDGSLMATVNASDDDDHVVSLHEVAIVGGIPQFKPLAPLTPPDNLSPSAVVCGPGGSTLYVAAYPWNVVVATKGTSGYAWTQTVSLDPDHKYPYKIDGRHDLAIDPSGALLYAGSPDCDSIFVFKIATDGSLTALETVALPDVLQAFALAVTAHGTTLLAALPGGVLAIPTVNPNGGVRQRLDVESPEGISVTPSGAYAFVRSFDSESVSLLDVWNGPPHCALLRSIPVPGLNPADVSVSPDGLTVLLPDPYSPSVGVISLELYAPASVVGTVGAAPTDVAVSPDAKAALVWHDAPGVCHYAIDTEVVSEILSDIVPVECVFGPSAGTAGGSYTAYAIDTTGRQLHLVRCDGGSAPVETAVDLPGPATAKGLALSSYGETVFLVMADGIRSGILIGSVSRGAWETWQTLGLFEDEALGSSAGVTVTPDGSHVFIVDTAHDRFRIAVRDEKGQYALSTAALPITTPRSVAVLPDSTKAYVCESTYPNRITIVDIATLTATPVSVMDEGVNLGKLVVSPDGRRLLAADSNAAALRIIDPRSLRFLQAIPLAQDPKQAQGASSIAIAPDGSRIFVTNTTSGTMSVLKQNAMGAH